MIHVILNLTFGLIVLAIVVWRLTGERSHAHTKLERVSLALLGAGMIMATPALWMHDTPFDNWSFNMSRAAMALLLYSIFIDRPWRNTEIRGF